jgi:hypothetical protein
LVFTRRCTNSSGLVESTLKREQTAKRKTGNKVSAQKKVEIGRAVKDIADGLVQGGGKSGVEENST